MNGINLVRLRGSLREAVGGDKNNTKEKLCALSSLPIASGGEEKNKAKRI